MREKEEKTEHMEEERKRKRSKTLSRHLGPSANNLESNPSLMVINDWLTSNKNDIQILEFLSQQHLLIFESDPANTYKQTNEV